MAEKLVALLRGINVGGKNRLPMAMLRDVFASLGAADVETYIQSGNVVFRDAERRGKRIAGDAEAAIFEATGMRVPVIIRGYRALAEGVSSHAFASEDPKLLHMGLLASRPSKKLVDALDGDRSPGDRFAVRGDIVYLFCPNGMARTKLTTGYFDRALDTVMTVRNMRTMAKLVELAAPSS